MTRPTLEQGFEFWRQEVDELERPEKSVPYIPIIALVGTYAVLGTDTEAKTSYSWRQTVLASPIALAGLRMSLTNFDRDRVDDTYNVPLEIIEPDETVMGGQSGHAYTSVLHGMPMPFIALPENEIFLATTLGLARHDHNINFFPQLDLSEQGLYALRSNYPRTSEYLEEHSA